MRLDVYILILMLGLLLLIMWKESSGFWLFDLWILADLQEKKREGWIVDPTYYEPK